MEDSYLLKSISGRYNDYDENRLSRIFCASFNNSIVFRNTFLQFIENECREELVCDIEWKNMDIVMFKKGAQSSNRKPIIVIENKTEDVLKKGQLKRYNKIPDVKKLKRNSKIALVKYFFHFSMDDWTILHWSEFYRELHQKLNTKIDSKEKFIIDNFINYLKVNNMALVEKINKEDLNKLADFIYLIKDIFEGSADGKKLDTEVFETATNYFNILEFILGKIKESELFIEMIGRNIQFSPRLGDAYDGDSQNNGESYCGFTINIKLNQEHRGIRYIRTGLFFNKPNSNINNYSIYIIRYGNNWKYKNKDKDVVEYKLTSKGLVTDEYKELVLKTLKKWLRK